MKFLKQFFVTAVLSLALMGGCGQNPQKPEQIAYDVHGKYATGLQIAVAYKRLPPCDVLPAPLLCAKPAIVEDLQKADDVAYPALQAYQATARADGVGLNLETFQKAAEEAVKAFVAITDKLPKE